MTRQSLRLLEQTAQPKKSPRKLTPDEQEAIRSIEKMCRWKHLSTKRNASPIDARCLVADESEFVQFADESGNLTDKGGGGFLVYKQIDSMVIVCYSGAISTTVHASMLCEFAKKMPNEIGVYAHADVDLLEELGVGTDKPVGTDKSECKIPHVNGESLVKYLRHLNEEACWFRHTEERPVIEPCGSRWVITEKPPWKNRIFKNEKLTDLLEHNPNIHEAIVTDEVYRFNDELVRNLKRVFVAQSTQSYDYKQFDGHYYVDTPFDPYVITKAEGGFLNLYQTSAFDDRIASPFFRYRPKSKARKSEATMERPMGFYDVPVGDLVFLRFTKKNEDIDLEYASGGLYKQIKIDLEKRLEIPPKKRTPSKSVKIPDGSGDYSLIMREVSNLTSQAYVDRVLEAIPLEAKSADSRQCGESTRMIAPSRLPPSYSLRERMIDMLAPMQYSGLTSTSEKFACQPPNDYAYLCRIYTVGDQNYLLPVEFYLPLKQVGRVVILGRNKICQSDKECKKLAPQKLKIYSWDTSKLIKWSEKLVHNKQLTYINNEKTSDDIQSLFTEQDAEIQSKGSNDAPFFSESFSIIKGKKDCCKVAYVNGVVIGRLFMNQIKRKCEEYKIESSPIVSMFDIHAPFFCFADGPSGKSGVYDIEIKGSVLPWRSAISKPTNITPTSIQKISKESPVIVGWDNDCLGIYRKDGELFMNMNPDFILPLKEQEVSRSVHYKEEFDKIYVRITDVVDITYDQTGGAEKFSFPRDAPSSTPAEAKTCDKGEEGLCDKANGMPYQYFFDAFDLIRTSEFGQLIRENREDDIRVSTTRKIFQAVFPTMKDDFDVDDYLVAQEARDVDKHDAFCLELRHNDKLIANVLVVNADVFGKNAETERRAYRTLNWKLVKSGYSNIKSRVKIDPALAKLSVADTSPSRCVGDMLDHFLEQLATYFGQPIVPCDDEPIIKPVKHTADVIKETPNRALMANATYTITSIRIRGPTCQLTFGNGTSLTVPRRAALIGKDAEFVGTFDAPLLDSRIVDDSPPVTHKDVCATVRLKAGKGGKVSSVFEVLPDSVANTSDWTAQSIVDVMGKAVYNCGFVSKPTASATIPLKYDPPDQAALRFAPLSMPMVERDPTAIGLGDSFTPDQSTAGLRVRVTSGCDENIGPVALRICAVTDSKTAVPGLPNALSTIDAPHHVHIGTRALRPVKDDPTALVFDVRSRQAYAHDVSEPDNGLFLVTVTIVTRNPKACRMTAIRSVRDCLRVDVLAYAVVPRVEQYIDIENRRIDDAKTDSHALSHSDVGRRILIRNGALYVDDFLRPCETQKTSLEGVIRGVNATVDGIVRVQTSTGMQCMANPSTVRRAPFATVQSMHAALVRVALATERYS